MSLNGLDDPKVKEAHEAAVAEPGGWFLLKYASRDEVEILSRGNGGIVEARNNIAQYDETSPLYGFLRYRRRNVIVKYLPEGCSRLIQARVAVHFNAVCDRFSPYDTTFEIAEAKELKDTKLSAVCSPHTASASTSSSTSSLRRRRLMEIAEEEEEEQREAKRQSTVEEEDQQSETSATQPRPRSPVTGPRVTLDSDLASSPEASQFAGTSEPPSFIGVPRPPSPAKSFGTDTSRRMSSQSSRQDYYSYSSYQYSKPRVKLGPRPSVDPAGRPRTSAGSSIRPVASMPASLKLSLKGAKKGQPKIYDDSSSAISEEPSDITFLAASVPIPENSAFLTPDGPFTSGARPSTSSGVSVKSLPSIATPARQNIMTPEKVRLMKAMQLREKKKRASAQPPLVPLIDVPAAPVPPPEEEPKAASEDTESQDTMQQSTDTESEPIADQSSVSKADSVIDVASTLPTDHASVHTQTDSRPASPICAPSEIGDSTKASSISESTEETVHAQGEKEHRDKDAVEADIQDDDNDDEAAGSDFPAAAAADRAQIEDEHPVRDADKASLTQTEQPDIKDVQDGMEKETVPIQKDLPPEHGLIPTSKFAARPQHGQAAVESMDPDPQDVTSGPGRIDEVEPAPVEPAVRTQDGSAASPPKWNLPISKYSTHDTSKSLAPSPIPAIVSTPNDAVDEKDNVADAADTMEAESASVEKRRSRRPEPIKTDLDNPDKQAPQEDEKAMDEPQSATIQEAKSITVTSPVTATPPGQPSQPPTPRIARAVSSPVRSPLSKTPGEQQSTATRSISSGSALQQRISPQPPSAHLAPRQPGKLSSGISSRIKAFEQLSGKPSASLAAASKDRPSSAFFSVRKTSIIDGPQSPSFHQRTNSISRGRTTTPAGSSPEAIIKPSRERSTSVASRMSMFEGGVAPRGRPETIQVTARVVRDPGQSFPKPPESQVDPTDYALLELRQSPLIIDHRKATDATDAPLAHGAPPVPTPLVHAGEPRMSLQERRLSKDLKGTNDDARDGHRPGQRTSLTMARDFIRDSMIGREPSSNARPATVHQNSSFMGRLSISNKRASLIYDAAASPANPLSPTSMGELSESGDEKKSKEGNRASRFMRRLSSSLSPGRKQTTPAISPILAEEDTADVEKAPPARAMTAPAAPNSAPIVAYMGDVNVQFPENLLWKRRTMSLDADGNVHLSAVNGVTNIREKQLRRYHLSDFKRPYVPEIEVQELPNSVCLDLVNGSGLQIAFQDRAGQLNGLHVLQDAHQKHAASLGA